MTATATPEIRLVHEIDEMRELLTVFGRVWGITSGQEFVSADVMKALSHAGNYLAGVFVDGVMIGGSMAFRGVHAGAPSLHSHVTGVVPGRQHAGLGRALKQHQRMWALDQGLASITWTFDPLVRRNAWFNLQRLGVRCDEFLVDFYGPLRDEINGDDETDRLLAVWDVSGSRAIEAADDALSTSTSDELVDAGAQRILAVGGDDRPSVSPVAPSAGRTLLAQVPADIVVLRRADRAVGAAWRQAARDTIGAAVHRGYVVSEMTSDGWYVLRHR